MSCSSADLQMKARCKHRGRPSTLSSRLARRVTHLKQKVAAQRGTPSASMLHGRGTPGGEDNSKTHCRQGSKGGSRRRIYKDTTVLFFLLHPENETFHFAVHPADLQPDWAPGQTVKRKRGRKPKAMMGDNLNRPHHKDDRASEKQEVREEKSDSESSEHGTFLYG